MKPEDLRLLAERADDVEGRPATRVRELHARIEVARRRRTIGAVLAAVLAVVLAISATSVVLAVSHTQHADPVKQPRSVPTPETPDPVSPVTTTPHRELVWARGSVIHVGDRRIDAGGKVWEVQATDGGAVFMHEGSSDCFHYGRGCNELWFTDGAEIVHIGTVYGSLIRGFELTASSSGSTVVWFEPSPSDHPHGSGYEHTGEYVVYDVASRSEVARLGSDGSAAPDPRNGWVHLIIESVFEDSVYWTPDNRAAEWCAHYVRAGDVCGRQRALMRLDVGTGVQTKVPWSAYASDRQNRTRMFFPAAYVPDQPYNAFPGQHPGSEMLGFHVDGDHFVAEFYGGTGPVTVRLGGRDETVQLRPPLGYHVNDTNIYSMIGWLDDRHVIIQPDNRRELLVCRLPDGRCKVGARGVDESEFRGHG